MSGTSLDGVDIAIVDFTEHPPRIVHCSTATYSSNLRDRLRQVTQAKLVAIDDLCRLDVVVAQFYAELVNQTLTDQQIDASSIRAIGCHGQTIRHSPRVDPIYTLQIGDPNTLAARTGITTVADFRRRDMAHGGQGAPLAPAFHQFIFRSQQASRAIINIGGIANISFLPADINAPVIGFDTGPGNTLLDYWIKQHQSVDYDRNGDWAASGQVIATLLQTMLDNEVYFQQALPKSTGTEYFNPNWLQGFIEDSHNPADVQATLVELTATTIMTGIELLPNRPKQCFVCGGGVHNRQIMRRLATMLSDCKLAGTETIGMNPDFVEAVAFAWLARETLNQRAGNLPSVTHADSAAVLGGIFSGKTIS